jgi:Spy/CpxP family protein refolding chaperone
MNARKKWLIAAVALLIPIAAWAQAQGDQGGRQGTRDGVREEMRRGMHGMRDGMRGGMRGMRDGMRGMRHGGLMARWADLDLSDEQRERIRDLHDAQRRKAVQRRADMQLARLDLGKLMREDRPNSASVSMAIGRIARLHEEGLKARVETHLQARALLTPEQRQKLLDGGMDHRMRDGEL